MFLFSMSVCTIALPICAVYTCKDDVTYTDGPSVGIDLKELGGSAAYMFEILPRD